ncbi:unnamed protein product, partial [Cladocopium goreaui]
WLTMDLPIEDGWDLICDSTPVQLMQPTPKTCPLSRPDFSVQPRLQARWQVSPVPVIGVPRTTQVGPRLTVAGLLDSEPKAAPAYQPIRSTLSHHVSCVGSPYLRTNRTEYHPDSLTMRAQPSMLSEPLEPKMVVPALCPSTEKALPRPPVNKGRTAVAQPQLVRSSTSIQLTRSKLASDNAFLVELFTTLLQLFGNSSAVYTSLNSSPYADEHRKRLLNNYAATTSFRYLQAVQKFARVTAQLGLDMHTLSESQLADVLTVMRLSKSCETDRDVCSGNFTIKALRWWHKIAGVSHLMICFSPLVDSFLKTKLSKDRREAPPLPLWVIFRWERRILQGASTTYEVMMLGAFLLITWAGLRFADAQRLNIDSLVFNFQELRGLVWRSKTMAAGHPFGAQAAGLCSKGTYTWLFKFLQTWDQVMTSLQLQRSKVDFLIPSMEPDGTFQVFEPLNYAETTRIFRAMLLTPWKKFQDQHPLAHLQQTYTLHSMKATLLSFGPQLGSLVSDSDRLLQGHHQDPKHSLNLYGRDSVWGSLRYQSTIIMEIQKGWRPKTAQHRGGQFPLTEPTVEQLDSDTESSSDSSQGDSSSSEELEPNANKKALVPDPCQADEAKMPKLEVATLHHLLVDEAVSLDQTPKESNLEEQPLEDNEEPPLSAHLTNWQSAEDDIALTRELVQQEIDKGDHMAFSLDIKALHCHLAVVC